MEGNQEEEGGVQVEEAEAVTITGSNIPVVGTKMEMTLWVVAIHHGLKWW